MEYIGFDYHKQYSFATKINTETGVIQTAKLANTPEATENFITNADSTHTVLESSRTLPVLFEIYKTS